jgi:hypothetical protein
MARLICYAAFALATSGPLFAAGSYSGTLLNVWAGDTITSNKGYLQLSTAMSNPACSSAVWFVVDLTDPVLKFQYSTALAAIAAGKPVQLRGTGTCDGNFERLRAVGFPQ